jgi:hypothetical protein
LNTFLTAIEGDEKIDGEYPVIDFNKIIPMPMALRNTEVSSCTDDAIYYYLVKTNQVELISKILRHPQFYTMDRFANRNEKELNELVEIGEKYVEIFKECGAKDWYDWRNSNWGTKWNAYETQLTELDTYSINIEFQTAWNGVPIIIQKLTEMFPNLTFEYDYADEDMGYNCGSGYGENGEFSYSIIKGGSDEAMRTYALCWGYDFDEFYQDEDGHWHYREWDEDDEDDE